MERNTLDLNMEQQPTPAAPPKTANELFSVFKAADSDEGETEHNVESDASEPEAKRPNKKPKSKESTSKTYKKKYKKEWEQIPELKPWLSESVHGCTYFYCKFCKKDYRNGKSEIFKHMSSIKHQKYNSKTNGIVQRKLTYSGLLCPTFTPFENTKETDIDYNLLQPYAQFLKTCGVEAVLINDVMGEGMSLTIDERKRLAQHWSELCRETQQLLMVQIGGAPLRNVIEMAMHAEKLNVEALVLLPDLYNKPASHLDLIRYIKLVSESCRDVPILYHHYPKYTNVDFNVCEFLLEITGEVDSFAGIIYNSSDLQEGLAALKLNEERFCVFMGTDQAILGAIASGFSCVMSNSLNIFPNLIKTLDKCVKGGDIDNAQRTQNLLNTALEIIYSNGEVPAAIKAAFSIIAKIAVAPTRNPIQKVWDGNIAKLKESIMEISIVLMVLGGMSIAYLVLFIVYKTHFKEKSYDDARAEQRQKTTALIRSKPKPKDKKTKKAAKKTKDKPVGDKDKVIETEEEATVITDNKEETANKPVPPPHHQHHVEFKPEPEQVSPVAIKKTDLHKHQEPVKEKLVVKEKRATVEVEPPQKNKKTKQIVTETPPAVVETAKDEKIIEALPVVVKPNGFVSNTGKEKKKKKSEYNARQQLTSERDGLLNLVRKAELSRSDVQLLIDLLLNKQQDSVTVVEDWSEGKSDPVQKLKKQLAEKEKALGEEQQALANIQAKLREVRAEQQTERTLLQRKIRGYEEVYHAREQELKTANQSAHACTQKMQHMQVQMNEELMRCGQENNNLQMQLQQQQIRLAQLQEKDLICEELTNVNQKLVMEVAHIRETKDHQQQTYEIQLNGLKKELDEQADRHRHAQEIMKETEKQLEMALRQEHDRKTEISKWNSRCLQQTEQIRGMELETQQLKQEIKQLQAQKCELNKKQEEILSQANGTSEESKIELLNLSNELSSVKSELELTISKHSGELDALEKKYKSVQVELEEQKTKNNKLTEEIRLKERDSSKQFILRLFPEINELKNLSSDNWHSESGDIIKNFLEGLKAQPQQELVKLKAQIQHYKNIIDDTEGTLNKLQSHIEQEEIKWRSQLSAKNDEIQQLKEQHMYELTTTVNNLEEELSLERLEKQKLQQQKISSETQAHPTQNGSTTVNGPASVKVSDGMAFKLVHGLLCALPKTILENQTLSSSPSAVAANSMNEQNKSSSSNNRTKCGCKGKGNRKK